jgi:hypothetical protein
MRTTITLDPDTAAKVKAEMRRTGLSFKQVVNGLLRRAPDPQPAEKKPFKVRARVLGLRPGLSYDNVGELLEQIEGPFYK